MKNKFVIGFLFILVIIFLFGCTKNQQPQINTNEGSNIIGNQDVLSEIDRLLLPLSINNFTDKDFDKLRVLVKDDDHTNDELKEINLMLKYNETTHIGHSLAFLHDYVKTGKIPICPGHSLSHYYIFLSHGENDAANENLAEAKSNFDKWAKEMKLYKGDSYIKLVKSTINKIDSGDNNFTRENVDVLSELSCT